MNYRFLSALAFVFSMYTGVKAQHSSNTMEKLQQAAPSLKIGYVDMVFILENLPEARKSTAEIQSFQKQLENQMQTKAKEYQQKAETFQQQQDTFTEAQKKQKIIEMSKLESELRALQEQHYPKMQDKYKTVMQPLHDKIQTVIYKIAQEHAYTFVFNKNTEVGPVLLFAEQSFDLSELVLEKLKAVVSKETQPPVVGSKAQIPAAKVSTHPAKPVKKK
ncbi:MULTISPECIES: OmpH family outer membrane protein [Candidatus Cardinium]|uniref:OmpH family outer membrane protein n=1 Tax=Candidatus Cardinium TaxID=273135 RepID=UPI001FA9B84D|nr:MULTISPECIES: OmpH family outer membrane protein [Cardinium]